MKYWRKTAHHDNNEPQSKLHSACMPTPSPRLTSQVFGNVICSCQWLRLDTNLWFGRESLRVQMLGKIWWVLLSPMCVSTTRKSRVCVNKPLAFDEEKVSWTLHGTGCAGSIKQTLQPHKPNMTSNGPITFEWWRFTCVRQQILLKIPFSSLLVDVSHLFPLCLKKKVCSVLWCVCWMNRDPVEGNRALFVFASLGNSVSSWKHIGNTNGLCCFRFGPTLKVCLSQICGYRRLVADVEALRKTSYSSDNMEHERLLLQVPVQFF